jgi:hypothetical protein
MPAFLFLTILLACFLAPAPLEAREPRSSGGNAVPTLDIDAGCKDVADMNLSRSTNYPQCIAEEQTARAQLQGVWTSVPASDKELCINLVTPPALPSYVTLQQCLDMARDAKKAAK